MAFITGIAGAAAGPVNTEVEVPLETAPPDEIETSLEVAPAKPEPGPGLEERSYSLVGRAMRFVMRTVSPGAWQSVVQMMAGQLPTKIELEAVDRARWEREPRHAELAEELRDQGFVDAGMFRALSMNTILHLLVNEAYDIRAVVYEREDSGIVLDLVTLFGDGTGITYVNRDDPGYEQPPLHPNLYLGNVPVFELLDSCLRERPKKARLPVTVATAARLMELEYGFGAKRLRGEPVNPIEIADAYLEVIEQAGGVKLEADQDLQACEEDEVDLLAVPTVTPTTAEAAPTAVVAAGKTS